MDFDLGILAQFYVICLLFALGFVGQRLLWRWRRKGFRPSGAAFGNALHELQTLAEPEVRYVIEERSEETAEDDGSSGDDDPKTHFMRQALAIRRGKGPAVITVKVKRTS